MKEEQPDASLHKLAEQNGDGLVPELHEILAGPSRDRSSGRDEGGDIIKFPADRVGGATTVPKSETGRLLPFGRLTKG